MSGRKERTTHQIGSFLECPLWCQPQEMLEASNGEGFSWQDHEGYVYRFGHKTPDKTDVIVLMCLLLQSKNSAFAQTVRMSRYRVLRNCGLKINSQSYARLIDSLKRWKLVEIEFSGAFYNGKSYRLLHFGVIDNWEIDAETKQLKVTFSTRFIEMMSGQDIFKGLDFTDFKQLRSPLATRLYEILQESFHGCDFWEIDAMDLARQIPMQERYPAHILPKIRTAIARINRCKLTTFHITSREIERGQVTLCFQTCGKDANEHTSKNAMDGQISDPAPEIQTLLELLPPDRRQQTSLLEAIIGTYRIHGADYVERNIQYANRRITRNYRSILLKAFQKDLGLTTSEKAETGNQDCKWSNDSEEEIHGSTKPNVPKSKEGLPKATRWQRVQQHMATLSPREMAELERKVIATLPAALREIVVQERLGAKTLFALTLEGLIGNNLDTMPSLQGVIHQINRKEKDACG